MSEKAKYSKFLKSPKWNETVFSGEGYLVTLTNLDPKDERSYYHKQSKTLLSFDWITSPNPGILLTGTRNGSELVDIKFLSKNSEGKWVNDESKSREAESKYKEHGLIAIHTTETECPILYTLSELLSNHKLILDVGVGFLVDLSKESKFEKNKFAKSFNNLVNYLVSNPDSLFDDFESHDPSSYQYLFDCGFEANLVSSISIRKSKYVIAGTDLSALPYYTELQYSGSEELDSDSNNTGRRSYATPKSKLSAFVDLLEDSEAISRLSEATKNLGYTLTPSEVISCLYGLASGVSWNLDPNLHNTPIKITDHPITDHPNWDPNSIKVKRVLAEKYQITPSQIGLLSEDQIKELLTELDKLK